MVHWPGCGPMIFLLGKWWSVCFCGSPKTETDPIMFDWQNTPAAISKASGGSLAIQ